jgi:hypothetical protein
MAKPAPTTATWGQIQASPPTITANAPIGHSRRNAIRPGRSVGSEVAVRAEARARAIASPACREPPIRNPRMAAASHHPPAKMSAP